jgi:ABC-type dipeptide/oligopeptide/nickel transport system ATPase subunit
MGFAAVAALGTVAGAAAGKAVGKASGKGNSYAVDTNIPGVTSATIKKGGKGGAGKEEVAQADIGQALQWFGEASSQQETFYNKGLNMYQTSLKQAAEQVRVGYQKANETLQPLSWSSHQALNEQMRMLGLDPISSTINSSKHALEAGFGQDIADRIAAAEKIKDPELRKSTFTMLNRDMGSVVNRASTLDADLKALGERPKTFQDSSFGGVSKINDGQNLFYRNPVNDAYLKGTANSTYDPMGKSGKWTTYAYDGEKIKADQAAADDWDRKAQILKDAEEQRTRSLKNQQSFLSEYGNNFNTTYDDGYTGQEVTDRIASTPGYQFQMNQGTAAIERQGAAAGMLGSGNTLKALTDYGQGLAQNYYGVYMNNLSNIVGQGSNATGMIATNQVNEGKDYGNLFASYGNAANNTQQKIGDAHAQSLYNKGNLYAQTAQFNASAQNMGIQKGMDRKAAADNQSVASAPGMQNAQTAANQFAYGFAQNQQAGQAYAAPLQQQSYSAGGVTYNPNTGKVV